MLGVICCEKSVKTHQFDWDLGSALKNFKIIFNLEYFSSKTALRWLSLNGKVN